MFKDDDPKRDIENTLITFMVMEVRLHGNQYGYAANKLSAIAHYHRIHTGRDVTEGLSRLKLVGAALKRESTANPKRPVRLLMMRVIRDSLTLDIFEHALAWGAMALAFFFLLRVGAYADDNKRSLRDADISLCDGDGALLDWADPSPDLDQTQEIIIILRDGKTDQRAEGKAVTQGRSGTDICPVTAVLALIRARRHHGLPYDKERHFLRRRAGAKPPLFTRKEVGDLLHRAAVLVGDSPRDYGTHSLRIGGASALFAANVPLANIRQTGGWKSDAIFSYLWHSREVGRSLAAKMVAADDEDDALLVSLLRDRRAAHRTT